AADENQQPQTDEELSATLGKHHQVYRAAVKRDEAGRLVEAQGREIANVHGQLKTGDVGAGKVQSMANGSETQATTARGNGQAKVDNFPDILIGDLGKKQDNGHIGHAWHLT